MKRLFLAIVTAIMFASCNTQGGNSEFEINSDGIGPIKLGMNVSALPDAVDGLYDKVEIVHHEAEYYGDDIAVEAYDYCSFKLNGVEVISSDMALSYLSITHPQAVYKGIKVGSSVEDVLNAGAKFYVWGWLESEVGMFDAYFGIDDIEIRNDCFAYGEGFSETGYPTIYQHMSDQQQVVDVSASDFLPTLTVGHIVIR